MENMTASECFLRMRKDMEMEMLGPIRPARMAFVERRIKTINEIFRQALEYGGPDIFIKRKQFPEIIELERLWYESQHAHENEIDYTSFSLFNYTVFSENIPVHIHEIIAKKISAAVDFLQAEKAAKAASALAETQKVIAEIFDLLTFGMQQGTRDSQCRIALLTLLNPCVYKGLSMQGELNPETVFLDEESRDEALSRWDIKRKHAQAKAIADLLPVVAEMYPFVTFNIQPVADFISNGCIIQF